eukprot:9148389-Pyramimonas_sp.AAC.1
MPFTPKMAPNGLDASKTGKMAQDGFQVRLRWPKMAPRTAQEASKRSSTRARRGQNHWLS